MLKVRARASINTSKPPSWHFHILSAPVYVAGVVCHIKGRGHHTKQYHGNNRVNEGLKGGGTIEIFLAELADYSHAVFPPVLKCEAVSPIS